MILKLKAVSFSLSVSTSYKNLSSHYSSGETSLYSNLYKMVARSIIRRRGRGCLFS